MSVQEKVLPFRREVQPDWVVFAISAGSIGVFVIAALVDVESVSRFVNSAFAVSTKYFGAYWQFLLLTNFLVALALAISPYGNLRLGGASPDMSTFKWVSILMCTVLAAGGVFWCFAEPMNHFLKAPPVFRGTPPSTALAVGPAMAQSFHHWGFLPWAICGTLATIVLMYAHYHRGLPLKPRTLLFPLVSQRVIDSPLGSVVDAVCIIGVAAGTIGPIGFLGLQLSYSFNRLLGTPDTYPVHLLIVAGLVVIYTLSTVSGIEKGIQFLSRINVVTCIILFFAILVLGPGGFIVDAFSTGAGLYLNQFLSLSLDRSDPAWLDFWTVFFWGWFLGYGPMTAMFIARISRGRTIREIVVAGALTAPVVTMLWFGLCGGSSIYYELQTPGVISKALADGGLPAVMLATVQQLPLASVFVPVFVALVVISLVAGGDSISYTMAIAVTGDGTPPPWLRAFWAILMGAVAAVLLRIGAGGITALQSFIVVSAVPVSIVLLPLMFNAVRVAQRLAEDEAEI